MKNLSRIFLIAVLVFTQGLFFSFQSIAETTYTLASPIPAVVNISTVSEAVSTASGRAMWKGTDGQVHIFGGFGANDFQGHYLNLSTGANALIHGYKGDARFFAYSPTADKLYMTGTYYAGMTEFDPNTLTARELFNPNTGGGNDILIGDDGLVYMPANHDRLYSYNPALGYPAGWKDYGLLHPNSDGGGYTSVAADGNYVYCKVRFYDGHYSLVISPTLGTPNFTEWEFGGEGDKGIKTYKINDGRWLLRRTLSDDSYKYYHLHDGTYTELSGDQGYVDPIGAPYYMYRGGWDIDYTYLYPIRGVQEYSLIKYRPTGVTVWNESRVDFPGPWKPNNTATVIPESGNNVFATGESYTTSINLNYKTRSTNYLGLQSIEPYAAMKHSNGEIYVGGYPSRVLRYDPTKPWTMLGQNNDPKLPSDPTKTNPYLIQINPPGGLYHYRFGLDYDAGGLVWIGGNTTRIEPDNFGNVAWYNPTDGSFEHIFPDWSTSLPTVLFRNLVAAANRTKIVVSASNGFLYVIDAATKTVDGTYNLGEEAYMADVDGVVVGVTLGGKIFRFDPVAHTMLTAPRSTGVIGTPFGFNNDQTIPKMKCKLEKGPDGYLWMFVGNTLYRINPVTLVFEKVLDTPYTMIKFAANNTDLLLYGSDYGVSRTDFRYIPNVLVASQTFSPADLDENNAVNLSDFDILKSDFLKLTASLANPKSDIDGDGQCTVKDIGILMSEWK